MKPLIIHNAVTQDFLNSLSDISDRSIKEFKKARVSNNAEKKGAVWIERRCWTYFVETVADNKIISDTVNSLFAQYKDIETNGNTENCLILYRDQDAGNYSLHQDVYYADDVRKLSMSILVTDDFTGGELEIMGEVIEMQKGDAVIFPSFLMHSVAPVKSGSRLALVSWMYGPQWR